MERSDKVKEYCNKKEKKRKVLKKIAISIAIYLSIGTSVYSGCTYAAEENENSLEKNLDEYSFEKITVEAKRPDWESKLSPGTVTIIRPDDYKGEQKTLPEFLKMVPGVHVREVNGKGQYTTVSVRGSTSAQVGVFVDGVLFNLGGDAAADISTIPVQNVERIEVYRGYIPSRFGGTFMGGVINIVTKRPNVSKVSASRGRSSYGGSCGSVEVDAPLGSGCIMFGLNRDQSDGNFKYTNRSVDESLYPEKLKVLQDYVNQYDSRTKKMFDRMNNALVSQGIDTLSSYSSYITASNIRYTLLHDSSFYEDLKKASEELKPYNPTVASYIGAFDNIFTYIKLYTEDAEKFKSADRYRKVNDYKNTDAILKWQDDHWLAKATWKQIKRHLPFPYDLNYGAYEGIDMDYVFTYPLDIWWHRNQKLTATEGLLGRRDTVGKLEWGWSVNYLDQNKNYFVDNWQWVEQNAGAVLNTYAANSLWSEFDSKKIGLKLDGTYKIDNKHLIEFLVNGSKEKMNIDGWRMHDFKDSSKDTRGRWRNYYEQRILNAQVQDTITLNKEGDFWLTPSVRYNRSTILGRSERYDENNDPQNVKWFHQEDVQMDDKVTWQMAIKKEFNDNFTLRATRGTYYRLLNMYEIAGDGAGIWPMPNVGGTDSVFPLPEEGSQYDISAIWDGKVLGAETAKFQLTFFGRSSDHLLQLMNRHFFFFYTNAAKAKVKGIELQTDLSWEKWDFNLQGTKTVPYRVSYDQRCLPGYDPNTASGYLTYQPKYEGTMRITYKPDKKWNFFSQLRYVGKMYISPIPDLTGFAADQSSLTTLDLGIKCKPQENLQITIGVNDVGNKANKMCRSGTFNICYPIQGRTYYATLSCNF